MQRVNAAAAVLLDPRRRTDYDRASRLPPVVLSVVPGAVTFPPTVVGRPVSTRVTVRSSVPLGDEEVSISATAGPGWDARVVANSEPSVVVVLEVTCRARVVGRVADTIVVRVAQRSAVIQVNGTVAPARQTPRDFQHRPSQTPPPPPPPPPAPRAVEGQGRPAPWPGGVTVFAWVAALLSVVLVGNSLTTSIEQGTIPLGVLGAIPWFGGWVLTAGLVGLAWATRLFTRGGWLLRCLTAAFVAPAVIVVALATVVLLAVVVVVALAVLLFALAS